MGVWDFIWSTTETVKRNAPDFGPVKNACKASYGYGSSAFWKIDNAVRVNGVQTLKNYIPDEQGRAQVVLFASKLAKKSAYYGFQEAYNLVPGGKTVAKIVSETVREVKSENLKKREGNKEVVSEKGIISPSGDISGGIRNAIDGGEMQRKGMKLEFGNGVFADSDSNQTPVDVLRTFMMKEFTGCRFDDLFIPQKGHGKDTK